jgi:hypothetical protein
MRRLKGEKARKLEDGMARSWEAHNVSAALLDKIIHEVKYEQTDSFDCQIRKAA